MLTNSRHRAGRMRIKIDTMNLLGVRPMREEFILKETANRPNAFRLGFVGFDHAGCQFVQKCRESIVEQHRRLVDFDEFFNLRISSASAKDCSCIVAAIGTETTAEQIVTDLKLLKILIEHSAGKMIRLEISILPISRIPITIVTAVSRAISIL